MKHILIADDHYVVIGGLEMVFTNHFPDYTIHSATNFDEIIKKLESNVFDMIILDINFEEENSINFIDKIFEIDANLKILIYSGLDEKVFASKLYNLGVNGFLSKMSDEKDIIQAIETILEGQKYFYKGVFTPEMEFAMIKENPLKQLTKRELEIMMLYAQGEGNLEISYKLNIAKSTVSTYKKRLFEKLSINNLSELINFYNNYKD